MKVQSKDELRQQINELMKQNAKLRADAEREKRIIWERNIPIAMKSLFRQLTPIFGQMICKVTLEHIDSAGYWFTFELFNDSRRQTYAVRHADLAIDLVC